ncbi:MAG TPA: DNA mismatch repair endonuclease MutL [Candidatus Omnitrophica bacterium]|nr:DNA mismatch repair endonuclease MutL [Candidatus Omnitrophota bacterium]
MGKIKILDDHTRSKISAGEVVERPASVVKELVENSIDAGSSEVLIEIKKAGKNYIRVVDNGQGMDEEDLVMAIRRYATSKIQNFEDIFRIKTLGFRGEALSAIASVSEIKISSRTKQDEIGNYVKLEAGIIKDKGKIPMPYGTEVIVRNLFFNTPARRKFLKTDSTEYNHILDMVIKFGLAFPEVEFQFISGAKNVLNLKKASFQQRIEQLFPELKNKLIPVEVQTPLFNLLGFLSSPKVNYPRRIKQYIFVNRRAVITPLIYSVIDKVYQGLITGRAYPAVFLFLDINPQFIDVNVHPTKREVKFKNEHELYELLLNILKGELSGEKIITTINPPSAPLMSDERKIYGSEISTQAVELTAHEIKEIQESFLEARREEFLIYKNKYTIWIDEEGINIVDNHAAWERVLFEKIKKVIDHGKVEIQRLLLPEVINLNPKSAEILRQNVDLFLKLGFEIKEFGENSFVVHTRPQFLNVSVVKLIEEVIADIIAEEKVEDKTYKIITSLACHSAVKAGDSLATEEIKNLISEVKKLNTPYCPHGRPALIKIRWQDVEKEFRRR